MEQKSFRELPLWKRAGIVIVIAIWVGFLAVMSLATVGEMIKPG